MSAGMEFRRHPIVVSTLHESVGIIVSLVERSVQGEKPWICGYRNIRYGVPMN